MRGSERAPVLVTRVSMLSICTVGGCTTIVFGQGTCVEHDERYSTAAGDPPTGVTARPEQPGEATRSLSTTAS